MGFQSHNSLNFKNFDKITQILYSHFARLWSPCCSSAHCQVPIPKLPTSHHQGYIAKLPSPLHPMDCPNELQAAPEIWKFLGCQMFDFLSAKMSAQKLRLPLVFFFSHWLLRLPHPAPQHLFFLFSVPPLSLSFSLDGSSKLKKGAGSPKAKHAQWICPGYQ